MRWSEYHDPPALFDWLRSLPAEGERAGERATAVEVGFRIWAQKNPAEAEAWLTGALPDSLLDSAIAELVRVHMQAAPESALAWSARIEDEALRRNATIRAGRSWRRRDAAALEAWLARNDLPESLKKSILGGDRSTPAGRRVVRPPHDAAARR
jgi:phage baseplate assembly protein W